MEDSIADGICDDANNNVECYFDGGDCCFNLIAFCDECICYYGNRKVTIVKYFPASSNHYPKIIFR